MSLCKAYGGAYAVADWRDILFDPLVKIVFIASNHAFHAEYAVASIEAGKQFHIKAEELLKRDRQVAQTEISARFWGGQAERKRWLRIKIWERLPPLLRPWLYFFYRLVLRGGFLDGWQGVGFHLLHALWFPTLIDLYYLHRRAGGPTAGPDGRAPR